jgi:hypothetical protein
MDAILYQAEAMRTAKLMPMTDMLVHAAMGCGSEVGELAEAIFDIGGANPPVYENFIEELGDCAWFVTYMATTLGVSLDTLVSPLSEREQGFLNSKDPYLLIMRTLELSAEAGKMLSEVKGFKFYGKPLVTETLIDSMREYLRLVTRLGLIMDIPLTLIFGRNVAKLRLRYPGKYSDSAAIARADKVTGLHGAFDPLRGPCDGAAEAPGGGYVSQDSRT